ncbi:Lsr2 family protein [Kocuria sabuli]|uniref:histone-like nucleoid-structuring protein Lsr2 n=1 Tax=Kocuria sabuli TaxID=3071448 RepID=UPI0034D737A6
MAQKIEIHLEDDLDGGPADHTVTFALDGKDYEIDLSADNAEKLREALRPYAAAGRKTTRNGGGTRGTGNRGAKGDPDTAKIRAWAKENGHEVSDRGRIHQSVKDAYYAAH